MNYSIAIPSLWRSHESELQLRRLLLSIDKCTTVYLYLQNYPEKVKEELSSIAVVGSGPKISRFDARINSIKLSLQDDLPILLLDDDCELQPTTRPYLENLTITDPKYIVKLSKNCNQHSEELEDIEVPMFNTDRGLIVSAYLKQEVVDSSSLVTTELDLDDIWVSLLSYRAGATGFIAYSDRTPNHSFKVSHERNEYLKQSAKRVYQDFLNLA